MTSSDSTGGGAVLARRSLPALAIALAFCVAACTDTSGSLAPIDTCAQGAPRPVTAALLVRVLRERGYDARTTHDCIASGSVAHVTNVVDERYEELDRIDREDGHVMCDLLTTGDGDTSVHRVHYRTDTETYLDVFNVSCAIYPDRSRERSQVARLEAALAHLARLCAARGRIHCRSDRG